MWKRNVLFAVLCLAGVGTLSGNPVGWRVPFDEHPEEPGHHADEKRAEDGGGPGGDLEPRDQRGGEAERQAIDDEVEQAKGENSDGQGEDDEGD